jgi:4-amino-4-deoxy-L-arabinose transferase-like glycosyltransferase
LSRIYWLKELEANLGVDLYLLRIINIHEPIPLLDSLMVFITKKGYWFFILLSIFVLIKEKKKAIIPVFLVLIAWGLSDASGNLLKHLIERPRPFYTVEGLRLLVGKGKSFSFPSNHAVTSFCAAMVFTYFFRYLRIPVFAVASLIAFSRVYVGVHYPSDIIGGALLGIFVALSVIYGTRRITEFYRRDNLGALFIFLSVCFLISRLFYINYGPLELSPDEAHYWEWSRRPDLSYYSKGPLIAYLIGLTTAIGGANELGVRFLAPFFLFFSSLIIYRLSIELYNDSRIGVLTGLLLQFIPLFAAYGIIMTIDSPFIFFWILSLYLFFKAIRENKIIWWAFLGVSTGLGMLAKYSMAFFYICGAIYLIMEKEKRGLLKDLKTYLPLIISLILFLPVLVWNIKNDFVTFRHTGGHLGIYEGLKIRPLSFLEFIGSQFGVITPFLFITFMIAIFQLTVPFATNREKKNRTSPPTVTSQPIEHTLFLVSFSLPVLLFFLLKSLQAKVQANWPLMAYPAMMLLSVAWYVNKWQSLKKWMRYLFVLSLAFLLFITPFLYFPGMLGLPSRFDPSSRLRGWKELGKKVTLIAEEMMHRGPFFIVSDKYQVSSEIAFYTEGNPVTYCVNLGRRMNQYDLWPGFHNFVHYNAIFVTIGDSEMPGGFRERFSECYKEVLKTDVREYSIFRCYDFKGMERDKRFERY